MSRSAQGQPRHHSTWGDPSHAAGFGGTGAGFGVLGVIGGAGGAGASCLAAALAAVAVPAARLGRGRRRTSDRPSGVAVPVLVDLDPNGGGLDVALGAENVSGARWSGLHAAGGRLDPAQLLEGLPRWRGAAFLACDGHVGPRADAVRSVMGSAREIGPIVLDLPRFSSPARTAALALTGALVVVVPGEIRAVTAAAAVLAAIADDGFAGAIRVVVRVDGAVIAASRIADVLELTLAGSLGRDRGLMSARDSGVDPARMRRRTRSLAQDLLTWAADAADPPIPMRFAPVELESVLDVAIPLGGHRRHQLRPVA